MGEIVVDGCVTSMMLQLLLDAVVDVHAISEGRGDDFYSLVGSHQFVANGKSQLNDSKVQGRLNNLNKSFTLANNP